MPQRVTVPAKRRDIQSLRALAVAIVVVYHVWPSAVPGGYVGVDVFFVISGFLITAHLITQVENDGRISLSRFWARRIRRLLPAAFVVLLFSFIAAVSILPRTVLKQAVTEIGASALYVQNWLLASNAVDYLAADNNPTLVQHFWSLSVEEQFYLVWPVLITGAVWLGLKLRPRSTSPRTPIGVLLCVVFVGSLLASVALTARTPGLAYFGLHTRAWEFALGGIVALIVLAYPRTAPKTRSHLAKALVAWAGIGLILASAFTFDDSTSFPGANALLPTFGAAILLLWGNSQSAGAPDALLDFQPLQYLGDLSYSIYLWHWPLIILYPYVFDAEVGVIGGVALILVTVVLAALTKRFVEDPFRRARNRLSGRKVAYGFMAAGLVCLVALTGSTYAIVDRSGSIASAGMDEVDPDCFGAAAMVESNNCDEPFAVTDTIDPVSAAVDMAWDRGVNSDEFKCKNRTEEGNPGRVMCEYGDLTDPTLNVALVGDSHGETVIDPLATYGEQNGWRVLDLTRTGCTALDGGGPIEKNPSKEQAECLQWSEGILNDIQRRDDIDVVIFTNRAEYKEISASATVESWNALRESGKIVIALRDVPGMAEGENAPECIERNMDEYDPCTWKPTEKYDFMMDAAKDEKSPTPVVDLTKYFCTDDGVCHTVIGGAIVYFDGDHLTYTFAQTLAPFMGEQIARIVDEAR
jgi:peptidoglycan/LPS O-acetylase OafA/YrhL